jgi:DNA-binding IclR family transcriptional regulator
MRNMSITDPTTRRRPGTIHVPSTGVGVLDRCVAILDAVERGSRSFTDVVETTGFSRTTTHRLVKALEAQGLLIFQGSYGYRLGPRLLRLAATAMRELPLRDLAHPILERLARMTGESSQLFIRDYERRVCIDSVESDSELRTIVEIGSELPLTAGSAGKIFLAFGPEGLRRDLIARAEELTEKTPVGPALEQQVATARRLGYATSAGERQPGVGSVSAPVLGPLGELIAVVSVSGPEARLGRIGAKRHAPAVIEAAHEVERALGVPG